MSIEDARLSMPTRGPSRSRTRSKGARPLTAATRPDISANTQMPTTPSTVAQARDSPNRAPTRAVVTRSPMSTNPQPRRRGGGYPESAAAVGVGNKTADADDPADGGEDPQRDREDLPHGFAAVTSASARSRRSVIFARSSARPGYAWLCRRTKA